MDISPAAKVGMITVLAVIVLALILTAISPRIMHAEGTKYYVLFDRVEGLTVGSYVRLAGVTVGKVTDIEITETKAVSVEITVTYLESGQPLSISKNSHFTIVSSLLGEVWLEILPRPGPALAAGEHVKGEAPVTVDMLMAKGQQALGELEASVEDFNKLVGDPEFKRNITETIANFNALSGEMKTAAGNVNHIITDLNARVSLISGHVDEIVVGLRGDLRTIGSDFRGLSGSMRRMGERNEPEIHAVVENLRAMSASLKGTMASVQQLVTRKEFNQNIMGTLTALRRTGEQIEGVASDVRSITSNPQVQNDLKETIHDARETVQSAKQLIQGVQRSFPFLKGGGKGGLKLFRLRSEVEYATDTRHVVPNASLTLLPDFKYSAILGVDSLGSRNLANVQLATGSRDSVRTRFGVVRSKLGVGFDTMLFHRLQLSADVYDTHDVHLDVIGRLNLLKDFYIMGGVRDTLDRQRSPVVGLGKRF